MTVATDRPPAFAVLIAPTVFQVEGHLAESVLNTVRINQGVAARLSERRLADLPLRPMASAS